MAHKKIFIILLIFLMTPGSFGRGLEDIKRSGKIYVAFTSDDLSNINYDLALEFARYLNVELVPVEIEWDEAFMKDGSKPEGYISNPDVIYTPDALKKADIICSTFTILEWRRKLFGFAETLHSAELLVIARDETLPKGFDDLAGKTIAFQGGTTFEHHMQEINELLEDKMILQQTSSSNKTKSLLLEGKVFGVVLDADEALNFIADHDQEFEIALPVSNISKTAWAVEKNNPLIFEVESFFETIASNGVLDELFENRFKRTYTSFRETLKNNQKIDPCHRNLEAILESGKLVVALRDRSFVYREGGQKQFMHALAEEFADYLGVSLEFRVTPTFEKYWKNDRGEIVRDSSYTPDWFNYFDLACETMAPLDWRTNKVNMVPVYPTAYTVIAARDVNIQTVDDLNKYKGVTGKSTIYEDVLRDHNVSNYYYESINNFIPEVLSGNADYTILYNAFNELSLYPELEGKLELGQLDISWALRKDQPELQKEVEQFIQKSSREGLIGVLLKALKGNTLQSAEAFINSYYESFQTGQLPYVNYGADDGLPQEDIFSIFQDRKGYMWFGTNSGAVRYNGREMMVFNQEHGLPANSVRDIKQDSSNTIYFATTNGIAVYSRGVVSSIPGVEASFHSIFIDSRNNSWFLGDEGLYSYDRDSLQGIVRASKDLPSQIYKMAEDPGSGKLLLATSKGVYIYDPESKIVQRLSSQECFSIYVDVNDSLWIATKEGILITHLNRLKAAREKSGFVNLNKKLVFPVDIISDITSNRFGSVWLISDSRIMQMISTDQKPIVYEQEIGIKNNKILSFQIDQEDNIWIGFSGGLQRLTNRKGLRNFYPGIINSFIYSTFQDRANRIWITSDNGVFYFQNNQLVNFTEETGSSNTKFTGTVLPNNNILLVNNQGLYEISYKSLNIVRHTAFTQVAHSIENIFVSSKGEIFLLTGIHGVIYHYPALKSQPRILKNKYTSNIFQLVEVEDQIIGGNNFGFVTYNGADFDSLSNVESNIWSLYEAGDSIWVGMDGGIGLVKDGRFDHPVITPLDKELVIKSILPAKNRNYLWLGTNKGFGYFNTRSRSFDFTIDAKDGLSGDEITPGGLLLDHNGLLWAGTYHGISNFNLKAISSQSFAPVCYIEQMYLNGEQLRIENGSSFAHNENNFVFEISALSFSDESSVEYEYYLRANRDQYTSYHRGNEYRAYYNNLPPGKYEFVYKAKGKNNIWGYAENFQFTVRKAWYHTWIFRVLAILLLTTGAYLFYIIRVRTIKAQNDKLEQQVRERTHDLEVANTEIEAQRDFAEYQHKQIAIQQKEILSSIEYARTIQTSLLPSKELLKKELPRHFNLFKPRDIVSGDFYWYSEQKEYFYLSAADCTGHGIPGAFMSMLGMALMNEIVSKNPKIEPADMLGEIRKNIIKTLHQKGDPGTARDGMDMVLIRVDKQLNKIHFAGANNPLYLVRNGELTEYKGDKMPVSIHEVMDPFTPYEIDILPGDAIFMFSDGFADQFGGPLGKKYKYKPFKELLTSISGNEAAFEKQEEELSGIFEQWMGDLDQIDDVVVIGIKF